MNQKKLTRVQFFHLIVDSALVAGSWLFSFWLRSSFSFVDKTINDIRPYLAILPFIVGLWLLSCWLFDVYKTSYNQKTLDSSQNLLKSLLMGLLLTSSLAFLLRELQLARSIVLLSSLFNLLLLTISRIFFHSLSKNYKDLLQEEKRILILGAGSNGVRILQKLHDAEDYRYNIVGFLDDNPKLLGKEISHRKVLGNTKDLRAMIVQHNIDEVFVTIPSFDHKKVFPLMLQCDDYAVVFWMLTNDFEALSRGEFHDFRIDDVPLFRLGDQQVGRWYEVTKRVFDVFVASVVLFLTLPFWVWWAFRIKKDSKGPVFFTQKRVGIDGSEFTIYKFRTMFTEAEPYAIAPTEKTDTRITKYGHFLRRTSIDELPQLWNVLKGDMSLVGPRPELPFIVADYEEWQKYRLKVKPGLSGLWQILGRKDIPMHENLHYDFYYIRNRSMFLDVTILFRTVFVVSGGIGAY